MWCGFGSGIVKIILIFVCPHFFANILKPKPHHIRSTVTAMNWGYKPAMRFSEYKNGKTGQNLSETAQSKWLLASISAKLCSSSHHFFTLKIFVPYLIIEVDVISNGTVFISTCDLSHWLGTHIHWLDRNCNFIRAKINGHINYIGKLHKMGKIAHNRQNKTLTCHLSVIQLTDTQDKMLWQFVFCCCLGTFDGNFDCLLNNCEWFAISHETNNIYRDPLFDCYKKAWKPL